MAKKRHDDNKPLMDAQHSKLIKELKRRGRIISRKVPQTTSGTMPAGQPIVDRIEEALARHGVPPGIEESKRRLRGAARKLLRDLAGKPDA